MQYSNSALCGLCSSSCSFPSTLYRLSSHTKPWPVDDCERNQAVPCFCVFLRPRNQSVHHCRVLYRIVVSPCRALLQLLLQLPPFLIYHPSMHPSSEPRIAESKETPLRCGVFVSASARTINRAIIVSYRIVLWLVCSPIPSWRAAAPAHLPSLESSIKSAADRERGQTPVLSGVSVSTSARPINRFIIVTYRIVS